MTWDDHCFYFGDYAGQGVVSVVTVGFLVRDDERHVVVAQSLQDTSFKDAIVIDKRMVKRVRRIKEV